ncbi:hypothetical protein [Xanthobacter autotrophicus]|uniref:hypothetical protein n=1 Tax=Xanthobacter autotrophicus TaxID=280 RepID=UPI00372B7458
MTDFSYVIDTRTGVKRRLMPGDAMRDGEVLYMGMEGMHRPAILKLSDAGVAAFFRDGGMGGGKLDDTVPAGFFKDAYGRTLASGTGPERDRVEGFRIARDAVLADAWKGADAELADAQVNTGSFTSQSGEPSGEVPEVAAARKKYEADLANAWKQREPA